MLEKNFHGTQYQYNFNTETDTYLNVQTFIVESVKKIQNLTRD